MLHYRITKRCSIVFFITVTVGSNRRTFLQWGRSNCKKYIKDQFKFVQTSYNTSKCIPITGLSKYKNTISKPKAFSKNALSLAGTIALTGMDAVNSISDGEYVGATIDVLAGVAGWQVGTIIGVAGVAGGWAFLVGFGLGIAAGMLIDRGATWLKNKWYRR